MGSLSIGLRATGAGGGGGDAAAASVLPLPSVAATVSGLKLPTAVLDTESLRDKRFAPGSSLRKNPAGHKAPAPPAAAESRAGLGDTKDRRLAKLRHRAKTMEPPVLSFYGQQPVPLPLRFAGIKRKLVSGHEAALQASWGRLLDALAEETRDIARRGPGLIPSIDFDDIDDAAAVSPFRAALKRFGVGVVRGVVPPQDAAAWVGETRKYLESKHDIKSPSPQDPTCFDFFWTPAQIRARAHPHVLRAMRWAMGLWDGSGDDERMATRFPISYADRIRIHVDSSPGSSAADTVAGSPIIAQVDGGSLERWEPDGYGRGGTYDSIFRGDWEAYDPWDPSGRVSATPDLYNGAGSCSIFRMFQGLLALTPIKPGMVRLLPSPKLVTAYFLLRPFFRPVKPAPESRQGPEWDAYLAADNWELEKEPSTILHGAVPGHAQRVTELWHPHLALHESLVTPPSLQAGDYIIWHCDTAYVITSSANELDIPGGPDSPSLPAGDSPTTAPLMVYAPSCPLTQTNALYLARQRKAFLRGHPGPDFDMTGTGLNSEASHVARLGEAEIREAGGEEGLRAMGLAPYDVRQASSSEKTSDEAGGIDLDAPAGGRRSQSSPLSQTETELVRLANIILFPDKYEFYMATRNSTPDGTKN